MASRRQYANLIIREGKKLGASRKQIKAALEAGSVESGLSNPQHATDADSIGLFQIRPSMHPGVKAGNAKASTKWFFQNAKQADKGQGSGQLAQDVERSAFPGRYAQHAKEASRYLKGGGGSAGKTVRGKANVSTTAGVDRSSDRGLATLSALYAQNHQDPGALKSLGVDPTPYYGSQGAGALAQTLSGLKDTPGKTTTTPGKVVRKSKGGTGKGKTGIVELGKLAQSMGLHVGENPHFGGVTPVHVSGSYHYKGRAIDVSGDPKKMNRYAKLVERKYGKNLKELFHDGPGAPQSIKNGKKVGHNFVPDHQDHVHLAT